MSDPYLSVLPYHEGGGEVAGAYLYEILVGKWKAWEEGRARAVLVLLLPSTVTLGYNGCRDKIARGILQLISPHFSQGFFFATCCCHFLVIPKKTNKKSCGQELLSRFACGALVFLLL